MTRSDQIREEIKTLETATEERIKKLQEELAEEENKDRRKKLLLTKTAVVAGMSDEQLVLLCRRTGVISLFSGLQNMGCWSGEIMFDPQILQMSVAEALVMGKDSEKTISD